jgi:hypothetical protein
MSAILALARIGFAIAVLVATPFAATAEDAFKEFKQLDTTSRMPKLNAFMAPGAVKPGNSELRDVAFEAKMTSDGQAVQQGLSWYVFSPIPGTDGKLPLVASSKGGSADFQLAPGDYFVNVSFGRAGVTKKLTVPDSGNMQKQVMVLDAGGIVLNAVSGSDVRIPPDELSFSIYSSDVKEDGTRGLVMADVKPNTLIGISAGTYHVVSEYGQVNAIIRADIQVESGKVTEATIQHRAAKITLKLVSDAGGEAIADTAWSILTSSGDIVAESVSAFPTMVLSEGVYTAVARNKDKIYQRDFNVTAGQNSDVEVLLREQPQEVQEPLRQEDQAVPAAQQAVPQQPSPAQQLHPAGNAPLPTYEQLAPGESGTSMD